MMSNEELLFQACESGDKGKVIELLGKGCKVNSRISYGRTPLAYAVQFGHADIVDCLIKNGADVKVKVDGYERKNEGSFIVPEMPLFELLIQTSIGGKDPNRIAIATLLVKQGAAVNDDKHAMVVSALMRNELDMAEFLVNSGADVNQKDEYDRNPIILASQMDNALEFNRLIIAKGADVNSTTRESYTPLVFASIKLNVDLVKELLKNGADRSIATEDNKTALSIAEKNIVSMYQEKDKAAARAIASLLRA